MSPTVGAGLMPPITTGITVWDVDGDGTDDFSLENATAFLTVFANLDDLNGGRLVVPQAALQDGIAKLNAGFTIGPTLATAYKFHTNAQNSNSITIDGSVIAGNATAGSWGPGLPDSGFFGFKFTNGGDTHYGWGSLELTGTPLGAGYKITEAYYNNTPNASIRVGQVPEPSTAGLLALGAGGLAAARRKRHRS